MARRKIEASLYHTYGDEGPSSDITKLTLDAMEPVQRTSAYYNYSGIAGNGHVSVREGLTRTDYDWFRPGDRTPRRPKETVIACMEAADRIGLLNNVLNMMSSFAAQGIQILHPNKKMQRIYRHWFAKVKGPQVSERFCNLVPRCGQVFIKRGIAKLNAADMKDLQRGFASVMPDETYERRPKPKRNDIPIKYTFLNPIHIEMVHGELATFLGHPVYMLRVPSFLMALVRTPKTPTEEQLVADLPPFIRDPIKRGEKYIYLDNDKMAVYHYMKDDWQQWAHPMAYPIFTDLRLYEKMKLADMAALDGVISHIRLWKLGSLEHKIQPGPAMFQKLHDMLLANVGGGSMDLIWDAAIELQETGTEVSKFLGEDKYKPVLAAIYAGLGIPQSLTGGSTQGAGFTNNAISLKTMIERLQYLRMLLTDFWTNELRAVQEALGDKQQARVIYDNMTLYDEAAEKMVWVQLVDRDIVSIETMQERFGLIPEVEQMRMKIENRMRDNDNAKVPPKAGPFHNAAFSQNLTQTALQQGTIAPSEAGVKKKPKMKGDKSLLDHQNTLEDKRLDMEKEANNQKMQQQQDLHEQKLKHQDTEHKAMLPIKKRALQQKLKNKGQPQQGRPRNSKDTQPRKQRRVLPSTKAVELLGIMQWARDSQKTISDIVTPLYLKEAGKKNVRSLTTAQAKELEDRKFAILWNTPPMHTVDEEYVGSLITNAPPLSPEGEQTVATLREEYFGKKGVQPTIDEERELQISAYSIYKEIEEDAQADD